MSDIIKQQGDMARPVRELPDGVVPFTPKPQPPEEFDMGTFYDVRDAVRRAVTPAVDEGTHIDGGMGPNGGDLWATFGGIECLITVKPLRTVRRRDHSEEIGQKL